MGTYVAWVGHGILKYLILSHERKQLTKYSAEIANYSMCRKFENYQTNPTRVYGNLIK